jgi:PTS system D-glucosamine-specific IIC component
MSTQKQSVGSKIYGLFQRLGPALVPGIAIVPLGGLLLGVGAILTNSTIVSALPFLGSGVWLSIVLLIQSLGNMIINNLSVIFCISLAFSWCGKDAVAAFSAMLAYLAFHTTISTLGGITADVAEANWMTCTTTLGIPTYNMGVLSGIIVGTMTILAYNRFKDIKLPSALSFFAGKRFVPIMAICYSVVAAIPTLLLWPLIQNGLTAIFSIAATGNTINPVGISVIMICTYLLIPFGLHIIPWAIYSYQIGTYVSASGNVVNGLLNIYYAQLTDHVALTTTYPLTTAYMSTGAFIGFGIAFVRLAKSANKERTKSLVYSTLSTNVLTGITEPFAFSFLFSCFPLYICYSVLNVVFGAIATYVFKIHMGTGYAGGILDFVIYGPLQGAQNWYFLPLVIVLYAVVAYFVARYFIVKRHAKLPGQEPIKETVDNIENEIFDDTTNELPNEIINAFGGAENIKSLDCCATRLRVAVKDKNLVNQEQLSKLGSSGMMNVGNNYQIIYGSNAAFIANSINELLEKERNTK